MMTRENLNFLIQIFKNGMGIMKITKTKKFCYFEKIHFRNFLILFYKFYYF